MEPIKGFVKISSGLVQVDDNSSGWHKIEIAKDKLRKVELSE